MVFWKLFIYKNNIIVYLQKISKNFKFKAFKKYLDYL